MVQCKRLPRCSRLEREKRADRESRHDMGLLWTLVASLVTPLGFELHRTNRRCKVFESLVATPIGIQLFSLVADAPRNELNAVSVGFAKRVPKTPISSGEHGLWLATSTSFMLSSLALLLLVVLSSLLFRMIGGSGSRSCEGVRLAGVVVTNVGVVSLLGLCV